MAIKQEAHNSLVRIRKNVSTAYVYFKDNYVRYHDFRKYVFRESVNESQKAMLQQLHRPVVEFNILEAYISRLLGEFSKQEPSVVVMADDLSKVDAQTIDIAEGHLRHIIFDANKNGCEYQVYSDLLGGGFSAIKLWTEYANSLSFNQIIKFDRVYDPTLVGFDPLARNPDKSDGRFCFELFPKSKEVFSPTIIGF